MSTWIKPISLFNLTTQICKCVENLSCKKSSTLPFKLVCGLRGAWTFLVITLTYASSGICGTKKMMHSHQTGTCSTCLNHYWGLYICFKVFHPFAFCGNLILYIISWYPSTIVATLSSSCVLDTYFIMLQCVQHSHLPLHLWASVDFLQWHTSSFFHVFFHWRKK